MPTKKELLAQEVAKAVGAGKPIYQMSKWWARRRSSVFRSLSLLEVLSPFVELGR
jgi:hypothetical protein